MLRKLVKEEDVWLRKEFFIDGPLTGLGTGYILYCRPQYESPI